MPHALSTEERWSARWRNLSALRPLNVPGCPGNVLYSKRPSSEPPGIRLLWLFVSFSLQAFFSLPLTLLNIKEWSVILWSNPYFQLPWGFLTVALWQFMDGFVGASQVLGSILLIGSSVLKWSYVVLLLRTSDLNTEAAIRQGKTVAFSEINGCFLGSNL